MSLMALSLTLVFVAVAVGISMWQRLGMERDIFIGTVRSAVQLLTVGFVLHYIFQSDKPFIVLLILSVMITVATLNAAKRGKGIRGIGLRIGIAITITEFVTIGLLLALRVIPFTSQYIIPISGMTIGNAMVVSSLFLNGMSREAESSAAEVETLLALGATPRQAMHGWLRRSVRASMIPTIDGMKTVGLVQLPGMMTGMIIAGASPLDAVRYQILIMFAFASSAALTSIMLSLMSYRLWFGEKGMLRRSAQK
ncbi:membrane protein [Paenibacillus darwinianus]|uniref:Membrane protein n=1 Tax=Paenibacillus darwinianus TaxID=1380763 RepID=A0A9W5S0Y6_9BACL|nr:iron export ABC transporter permease subunit FetB [Paenibacillus darwinianus]EXX85429.1 membrane protein [Paenibacillus darwinianus]EXX89310.1 membrane protein [Paenibacillus darwinianus]EXX90052.1 membrane protein [Paenibacillus darwinianus]